MTAAEDHLDAWSQFVQLGLIRDWPQERAEIVFRAFQAGMGEGYTIAREACAQLAEAEAKRKAPLGGAIAVIGEGALLDFAALLREAQS